MSKDEDYRQAKATGFIPHLSRLSKWELLSLGLLLAILVAVSLMLPAYRWGDASTYYMQVQSIINDHDIQYTQQDIEWILQHPFDDTPAGLFLIKTPDGRYFYGKDFSYALFATPFFLLFGNNGFAVFNALMFFCMIAMGYLYLRKDNGSYSVVYSALFFLLSAYFVYIFWIHADIYNVFLIMLGLFLWSVYNKAGDRRFLIVSSLALGLAVVAKAPNAVVFAPLALFELYKRRYSNLILACGALLVPVLLFIGFYYIQTGSLSYYGGDRYYYNHKYPFTNGYNATNEAGVHAFSVNSGDTASVNLNLDNPVIMPYNLFYYFFGQFTGMLWYFPFAAFALLSFLWELRKPDHIDRLPEKLCILAAIVLYILTFAIVVGNNYAGNQIGNRYFYIYPAFIFLLGKVDVKKAAVFLLIALFTVVPLIIDPVATSTSPARHIQGFPYSYFPLEYSQILQLPLMGSNYPYQNYTLMVYGDRPAYTNGVFVIEKPTEMTIYSSVPIDQIKLAIASSNGSVADVIAGSVRQEVTIDGIKVVTIKGMKPAYKDNRYYIYGISVGIRP